MKYVSLLIIFIIFWRARAQVFTFRDLPFQLTDVLHRAEFTSTACSDALKRFGEEIRKKPINWAWQMADASTKLQPGLFYGNLIDYGNYEECLEVEGENLVGKHCAAEITISNLNNVIVSAQQVNKDELRDVPMDVIALTWSLCVPHQCTASDLNNLFKLFPIKFDDAACETKNDGLEFTTGDILASIFFGLLILMLILSTIYDLYLCRTKAESKHPLLVAFSAIKNGKTLLCIRNNPSQLTCLDGLRFLSMMWVVLGHEFSYSTHRPIFNSIKLMDWAKRISSMYILGATVSVDTFFVLSGFLVAYVFFTSMQKGVKFNIILFYMHRYIRLTPAIIGLTIIHLTLGKYFGSGPNWSRIYNHVVIPCEKTWWESLLYIQNYVNIDNPCIGQSWYLAIDMQLFVLSPLILLPLKKWPKYTIIGIVLLALGSVIWGFVLAWDNFWIGSQFGQDDPNMTNVDVQLDYYIKTHTRAAPWLIGIILGYTVFRHKNIGHLKLHKLVVWLLWFISLATLALCVYGGNNLIIEKEYNRFGNAAYIAFVRPAWAIALSWLIYACVFGYGGPINIFLSWSLFRIGSRFTYSIFIVHLTFIIISIGSARLPIYANDYTLIHEFIGDFVIILIIAAFWALLFESPFINIERALFGATKSKLQTKTNDKRGANTDLEKNVC